MERTGLMFQRIPKNPETQSVHEKGSVEELRGGEINPPPFFGIGV